MRQGELLAIPSEQAPPLARIPCAAIMNAERSRFATQALFGLNEEVMDHDSLRHPSRWIR